MISRNTRLAVVIFLLAGTALFLRALDRKQSVVPRTALASFPLGLNGWAGTDIPIPADTRKSLGAGEFLQRMYKDPVSGGAYVDLYVAYVPDQHAFWRAPVGLQWSQEQACWRFPVMLLFLPTVT